MLAHGRYLDLLTAAGAFDRRQKAGRPRAARAQSRCQRHYCGFKTRGLVRAAPFKAFLFQSSLDARVHCSGVLRRLFGAGSSGPDVLPRVYNARTLSMQEYKGKREKTETSDSVPHRALTGDG